MRATLALAATAWMVAAAGCGKLTCKRGTALVDVTFDAAARAADSLQVVVTLDGNTRPAVAVAGPNGRDSGTIEVDFPSGYATGKTLQVTVTALRAGMPVGSGAATITLSAGCSVVTLQVTAQGLGGGDMAMPDMLTLPTAMITAKPDLVGFVTSLDATGSSDPLGQTLTYKWAIASAPSGSQITSASLSSATASKPTFAPDLGGVYQVALTVTASDGRAGTTTANVTVPTLPIFYTRSSVPSYGGTLMGARVMSSDGTGDHDIACPIYKDMGMPQSNLAAMPFFGHAYDAPAGGTAMFAFLGLTNGALPAHLLVGTASTDCNNTPPVTVDNNTLGDHLPIGARFSPDGKRLVYISMPNGGGTSYEMVTVAVDGTNRHVVRSSGNFSFTPAIWLDNATVAWLESDTGSTNPFTIFKAADATAAGDNVATRTTLLRCDQGTGGGPTHLAQINQFQQTPFGLLVAGSMNVRCALCAVPQAAVNLYLLQPGNCSTTAMGSKTLVSEPTGGLSWDYDISPDGLNVIFSSTHGQGIPDGGTPEPQADIFLVPSDGSSPTQKLLGDPLYDDVSPRFIAGGRQIVWTRKPRFMDMGADTPAIMIANSDGTHVRALTSKPATGETVVGTDVGSNRGFDCSGAPGAVAGGGAGTAALAAVAWLLSLRRRRRRD